MTSVRVARQVEVARLTGHGFDPALSPGAKTTSQSEARNAPRSEDKRTLPA